MTKQPTPTTTITLIAAPLFGLLGLLLLPTVPAEPAQQLAVIAEAADRWLTANLVFITSQVLLVPAMLLLAWLLRSAGSRTGAAGAILMSLGAVLHVGVLGFVTAQLPIAQADATFAVEEMFGAAFAALLIPTLLTTYVGVILVAIGVWRTRIAPRWAPITLVVGPIMEFVEPIGTHGLFGMWALGFGAIAWRIWRPKPNAMRVTVTAPVAT